MTALANDCFVHDRDRLRHHDVLALIRERLDIVAGIETVALADADGRVLASDIVAGRDVPAQDNAAVDGYAYAAESGPGPLAVSLRIAAGDAPPALPPSTAARIFTGAPMPGGADTVAMQEDVRVEAHGVRLPDLREGSNRRRAGEDLEAGAVACAAGTLVTPADMAAIASTGHSRVEVRTRLRVGLLSNGRELIAPGEPFRRGGVYDSNRPMLEAILRRWGVELFDLGTLADDAETIRAAMRDAAERCDVLVTSGGASKGEEDHVRDGLDALGSRHLWQIAVKPGRPLMMGQIGGCAVVGLPGNPVAAFVCAILYLRPMLRVLGGAAADEPRRFPLPASFALRSKPDRREFLRGRMTGTGREARVEKFARDGSGLISGLSWADGLIEIDEPTTEVAEGDVVAFIPFAEFGISR